MSPDPNPRVFSLGLVVKPGSNRGCQHETQSGRSWCPVGFLSSGDETSLASLKGLH